MSTFAALTFDKSFYLPGETITATATGSWSEGDTLTLTTSDGATINASVGIVQSIQVTDSLGKIWQVMSNNGSQIVLTTTA